MIVRQILVGLLASLMLAASTGATIHQMVCLHSGNTEYSFNDIDCCKGNNKGERIKPCCCEYFSITYQTDELANTTSEIQLNSIAVVDGNNEFSLQQLPPKSQPIPNEYNLPPPHKQPIYKKFQSFLC